MSDRDVVIVPVGITLNTLLVVNGTKYRTAKHARGIEASADGTVLYAVEVRASFARKTTHVLHFTKLEYDNAVGVFRPIGNYRMTEGSDLHA